MIERVVAAAVWKLRLDHVLRGTLRARIFDAYSASLKYRLQHVPVNLSAEQLLVLVAMLAEEDARVRAMFRPVRWDRRACYVVLLPLLAIWIWHLSH